MTNRRTLFAIACLGMLSFGIVLTTIGAVLPAIVGQFHLDTPAASALVLLMSVGILAGSVVFGPIVDRYGYKGMLAVSAALIAAGLEGLALAPDLAWLRAAVLVVGFGGGIINGGTNAFAADLSADARSSGISILGVFFGIGAVGVPFALGAVSGHAPWSVVIAAGGAVVLVPLVLTVVVPFPAPKQAQGFPLAAARHLLGDPVLLVFGVMLFLESGIEITMGDWVATFCKSELGLARDRALYLASLYWLGMMLVRIVLGRLLRHAPPARVMLTCVAVAFVGAFLLVGAHGFATAAAGVFLVGCGFASTYPVALGFVGDRYATLSGTAFGVVIVMALTGGSILPWATGTLGDAYGLRTSLLIVPASLVLIVVLLGVAVRGMASVRGSPA